jgi:hypothetical protein
VSKVTPTILGVLGALTEGGLVAAVVGGGSVWLFGKALDSLHTPARSLTWADAMAKVHEAAAAGQIRIVREDGRTVSIEPHINGVGLYYMTDTGSTQRKVERLDPRLLVMLLRLTEWDPKLAEIHHLGIFPGGNPTDGEETHNRGTSIDLRKFVFTDGDTLDVLSDWGARKKWTGSYRLGLGDKGADWFSDLYDWLAQEATDRPTDGCGFSGDNAGSSATIGDRSFLITPDHGDPKLATAHRNHIHAQVGPTRGCGGRTSKSW